MNSRLGSLLLAGVSALVVACSHDSIEPTAGALTVNLASPNSDDGAVLFTVSGGPIDSVASPGHQIYSARLDSNTLRLIVTGELASGTLATIYLADMHLASNYTATVNQVAARGSYAQHDAASYTLTLSP
jgi:hypothetical protein